MQRCTQPRTRRLVAGLRVDEVHLAVQVAETGEGEVGIYSAALRLIDADGVEALTMRRPATELDANPMSLYHHVPNKEAAMRGMTRMVGAQFRTVTPEDAPWQERLRLLATDLRALAHRHPRSMAYSFSRQPGFLHSDDPFRTALTESVEAAGVPQSEVSKSAALLDTLITGLGSRFPSDRDGRDAGP
ncbi:MAG: helix-turn-helix transcriptional regulator [Streptomyces sp.]|nr:helix-turn-helix transcriptional regulator [Streptomyces sp.]